MKVIDLTHVISEDMPVFPGTETPKLEAANSYEVDGFKETLLTMFSHTGTHMDPPAHLYAHRSTLDSMDINQFVGKGLVIDCKDLNAGDIITMDKINSVKQKADEADFLLMNSNWDKYWGKDEYYGKFPVIDEDVANYMIATKKKGIGLDMISVDPMVDENLTTHKKLFKDTEIVVIENLTNLDKVGTELFLFCALPLKYKNSDGAPIRAVGILE